MNSEVGVPLSGNWNEGIVPLDFFYRSFVTDALRSSAIIVKVYLVFFSIFMGIAINLRGLKILCSERKHSQQIKRIEWMNANTGVFSSNELNRNVNSNYTRIIVLFKMFTEMSATADN